MGREQRSNPSAFEAVRSGINLDISTFQEQQKEAARKIRDKIKLLANAVKDKCPPLMIIKVNEPKSNNQGYFSVWEYSPSENMIYACLRHSPALASLDCGMSFDEKDKGTAGFHRQSIQQRAECGEGNPKWIEFAVEIIQKLEESAQNRDEKQIPTFTFEYMGKPLIFPIVPFPEDLTSRFDISAYLKETNLMRKKGGGAGNLYSGKLGASRISPK